MKQKIKLLLFLICLSCTWQAKAQTGLTCATSKTIETNTYAQKIDSVSVIWYSFVADSSYQNVELMTTSGNHINKVELYNGSCVSLNFVSKDSITSSTDITVRISGNSFTKGLTYYAKVYFSAGSYTKTKYNLAVFSVLTMADDMFTITNLNTGEVCSYDVDDAYSTASGSEHSCNGVFACVGDVVRINFLDHNGAPNTYSVSLYINGSNVVIPANGYYDYTTSSVGTVTLQPNNFAFQNNPPLFPTYITVISATTPTIIPTPGSNLCLNQPITFQTLNTPIYSSEFTPDNATSCGVGCLTFTSTGVHTVTCTINAGYSCSTTATYTYYVVAPTFSLSTSSSTCSLVQTFNLTSYCTNGQPFTWFIVDAGGNIINGINGTQTTSPSLTYTFPATGSYTVAAQLQLNTTYTSTLAITINPPTNPTLTLTPSSTICIGSSKTLSVSGATNYTWTPGSSNSTSITVTPTTTTVYSVTGANACGQSTYTTMVTVVPVPTITVNNATICAGTTATLTANGATSYTWMPGSLTGSVVAVTPTATTVYTITGSNGFCSVTKTATVSIMPLPTILVSASPSVICSGQSSTLTASAAMAYTWNPGAVVSPTIVISPTITSTYTVTGVSSNGCTNTKTITVTVNPLPTVSLTNTTTTICNGLATFTAVPTPTNVTYSWQVWDATNTSTLSVPITGSTTATPTINFSSINQNVNVCTTVTSISTGCKYTSCVSLLSCCATPTTGTVKYTNTVFTGTTNLNGTSTKYQFGGTITINSGAALKISSADVTMDPYTKFIVNSGGYLLLEKDYVHGCNGMWNGVFALNTATVYVNNSRIEDGIRTLLDSTGGATFIVNKNNFNKNYIAIICKANKPSNSSYSIYNNAFTTSNLPAATGIPYVSPIPSLATASTLYSYSVANLLPPYQNQKGYEGIQLINAVQAGATNSMIPIGSAVNGQENVFDKLQIGVHIVRANALVQNNVFQNIKNTTNPGTYNAGMMVYSIQQGILYNSYPSCNVQIGGATTSQRNTFIDNDYGVYSWFRNTLNIANNTFSTQTTGIYMQTNFNGLSVVINKNKFITNLKGVSFSDNPNVIANIAENRFDNSSATVGNATNNAAITLAEPTVPSGNPTSYGNYTVYNNYIDKYYNGVISVNTYSTQMTDNEVHMQPDNTSGNFQMGIKVDGSRYANATNNTVDMTSLNTSNWWWQYGVFYANAQAPFINCNIINNVGTSIKIQGPCNTLANTNEFVNNKMSNAVYGVWLDGGDFNQHQAYWVGTTPYAADNTWTGTMTKRTYSSASGNASNSLLFTQSGAQFKVALSDADNATLGTLFLGNNNSTANGSNSCVTQTSTPVFRMSSSNNAHVFAKAQQIAKGTLTPASAVNAANIKHMNRRYLLENIQFEGVDVSTDSVLANFISSINSSNIGKFNDIDSLLQSASLNDDSTGVTRSLAASKNNAINPSNTIEQNQKMVNSIYISKLNGSLNANQVQQLKTLAVKCPDTDGHAVFIARAILSGIDKTIYNSNCGSRSNARIGNDNEQEISASSNITIYPNPANNQITTELYLSENQNASILIYNIVGELVKYEKINSGKTTINTDNLKSGTYLYKINIDNNIVKTDKLIIIK
ncbi:MAG: T9SS type A sorting domain-containing protein [Bacteroidia bacterium]